MEQYGLNTADIEDAFRYGKDEGMGKYTRIYRGHTVVIVVAESDENEYLVTTCWKYKNWK